MIIGVVDFFLDPQVLDDLFNFPRLSFHSILGHRILSVVLYDRASFCFLASNTLTHGMAALLRIVNGMVPGNGKGGLLGDLLQ